MRKGLVKPHPPRDDKDPHMTTMPEGWGEDNSVITLEGGQFRVTYPDGRGHTIDVMRWPMPNLSPCITALGQSPRFAAWVRPPGRGKIALVTRNDYLSPMGRPWAGPNRSWEWGTLDEALFVYSTDQNALGIGIRFDRDDDLVCIDLDLNKDATPPEERDARTNSIVLAAIQAGAHVHYSPSGLGAHVIGRIQDGRGVKGEARAVARAGLRGYVDLFLYDQWTSLTDNVIHDGEFADITDLFMGLYEEYQQARKTKAPSSSPSISSRVKLTAQSVEPQAEQSQTFASQAIDVEPIMALLRQEPDFIYFEEWDIGWLTSKWPKTHSNDPSDPYPYYRHKAWAYFIGLIKAYTDDPDLIRAVIRRCQIIDDGKMPEDGPRDRMIDGIVSQRMPSEEFKFAHKTFRQALYSTLRQHPTVSAKLLRIVDWLYEHHPKRHQFIDKRWALKSIRENKPERPADISVWRIGDEVMIRAERTEWVGSVLHFLSERPVDVSLEDMGGEDGDG